MSRYRPPAAKKSPYITPQGMQILEADQKAIWLRRREEHDRQPAGPSGAGDVLQPLEPDPEDLAVEVHQCADRLVLGRRRDVVTNGQFGQEAGQIVRTELPWVAAVVKPDVAADPVDVRPLGAAGVVRGAHLVPHDLVLFA